jgi:ATP/maltotriose-dependent transcriptional regulator MalT
MANLLYLVLDDYHLVDGPDIQAGMLFLLEHLRRRRTWWSAPVRT